MDIFKFLTILKENGASILAVAAFISLFIEITPVKLNPLSALVSWIGRNLNKDIIKDVKALDEKVNNLKKEQEQKEISDMRWFILTFAQSCRDSNNHSKEQWSHALNEAKRYEKLCEKYGIENGVIEEDTEYLRNLYQVLSREHKIK